MSRASYHRNRKPVMNENLKREAVADIPRVGRKAYVSCELPRLNCAIDRRYQLQRSRTKRKARQRAMEKNHVKTEN